MPEKCQFLPLRARRIMSLGARPTLPQLWSFKIRRTTFLNSIKLDEMLILKLWNCENAGRVMPASAAVILAGGSFFFWNINVELKHRCVCEGDVSWQATSAKKKFKYYALWRHFNKLAKLPFRYIFCHETVFYDWPYFFILVVYFF